MNTPRPHAGRCSLWLLVLAVAVTVTLGVGRSQAYPEPKIISDSWQLEFFYKTPRLIAVDVDGDGQKQHYWYLPYTVTNNTGEDQLFVPYVQMLTDRGHLLTAGRNVEPSVYKAIAREQQNPLLVSPTEAIGKLLQGEDNARDSVAIWQAPDADTDTMTIFFGGLSGETAVVDHPIDVDDQGNPVKVVLRKTRTITFKTPGTLPQIMRGREPVRFVRAGWVMR